MVFTWEGAAYRLYRGGCRVSFVHGRVLYTLCVRKGAVRMHGRLLYIVRTREAGIYRVYMGGWQGAFYRCAKHIYCTLPCTNKR